MKPALLAPFVLLACHFLLASPTVLAEPEVLDLSDDKGQRFEMFIKHNFDPEMSPQNAAYFWRKHNAALTDGEAEDLTRKAVDVRDNWLSRMNAAQSEFACTPEGLPKVYGDKVPGVFQALYDVVAEAKRAIYRDFVESLNEPQRKAFAGALGEGMFSSTQRRMDMAKGWGDSLDEAEALLGQMCLNWTQEGPPKE